MIFNLFKGTVEELINIHLSMDESCEQDDDHRQSSQFPQHVVVVSAVIKEEEDVFQCNDVIISRWTITLAMDAEMARDCLRSENARSNIPE